MQPITAPTPVRLGLTLSAKEITELTGATPLLCKTGKLTPRAAKFVIALADLGYQLYDITCSE